MPKITQRGPSFPPITLDYKEGGDDVSVGNSSSASTPTIEKTTKSSGQSPELPVRTTENRSPKVQTETSSASSTGGPVRQTPPNPKPEKK